MTLRTGQAASRRERKDGTADGPVRILWLIKGLGPGGAEKLVCLAAGSRNREAFRYEAAYLLPWKSTLVPDLERVGVPVSCLRGGREWDVRWAFRLRRLLRDRRIDVLHIHSPYVAGIARLVARSIPARDRPRVVYTEHLPWPGYVLPTRILNAVTFPLDDAHLAVSEAVRTSVPSRLAGRLRTVVHGIDLDRVRAAAAGRADVRSELGVLDDEIVIGTIGNVRPQKRYPDLLEAARRVIDSEPGVRFVAAGIVPADGAILATHARLGLGERFRFLGFVDDATRLLAACDLFVLASGFEGLPVSMMEALALGLPVVATDVPGIRDEVRADEDGLLVPVARPDLLAEALLALVRDPARRKRMSLAAQASAVRFDIATSVRTTEALYLDLTRNRPR
jgi:L-malate glycosyltransferase